MVVVIHPRNGEYLRKTSGTTPDLQKAGVWISEYMFHRTLRSFPGVIVKEVQLVLL